MNETNLNNFFKPGVCHYCKCIYLPIKRCNSCKILAYCCKAHQVADWKNHKKLCTIIANEGSILVYNVNSYSDFLEFKKKRGYYWRSQLGRDLQIFETQMWLFTLACAVCFGRKDLFPCKDCLSVYYCSEEHQNKHKEHHSKSCNEFKLSLDFDCYFFHYPPAFSMHPRKIEDDLMSIPEDTNFLLSIAECPEKFESMQFKNNSDEILSGLTILLGLQQGNVIVKRKISSNNLIIHVVGSSHFEHNLNWNCITEIMFHWVTNVQKIHFDFIGPGCMSDSNLFEHFNDLLCNRCTKRSVTATANFHQSFYHDIITKLPKPDVVVAFNNGIHEYTGSVNDYWKESLNSLLCYDSVPLILTAYTENELTSDLNRILSVSNINIIYGPKKNIFSNMRPLQDWESEINPLYYINNYMAVVRKKS